MPRFVCISDTHNQLTSVQFEPREDGTYGDVLLHAGDATMKGKMNEIEVLNQHFGFLRDKFKHILYCPGNHDFAMENARVTATKALYNCTVLLDEAVTVEGYKVYGSPWQPWYHDWAFNFREYQDGGKEQAILKWDQIPNDTDILITHGPPYMMMDKVARNGEHVGCPALAERLKELEHLKLHVFGHIHERYGEVKTSKIHFVNAAICTLFYRPDNAPIIVDLPDRVQEG